MNVPQKAPIVWMSEHPTVHDPERGGSRLRRCVRCNARDGFSLHCEMARGLIVHLNEPDPANTVQGEPPWTHPTDVERATVVWRRKGYGVTPDPGGHHRYGVCTVCSEQPDAPWPLPRQDEPLVVPGVIGWIERAGQGSLYRVVTGHGEVVGEFPFESHYALNTARSYLAEAGIAVQTQDWHRMPDTVDGRAWVLRVDGGTVSRVVNPGGRPVGDLLAEAGVEPAAVTWTG